MPTIIQGALSSGLGNLSDTNYGYDYPEGLDLKPGSAVHKKLKDLVLRRAKASHSIMSKRYSAWNEVDRTLTTYIPLSEKERITRESDNPEKFRKPVSVVVPYSYATLETLLTHLTSRFLGRTVFKYAGRSAEDLVGAHLLTEVVRLQTQRGKAGLALHTMFRDSLAYGIGPVAVTWDRKVAKKAVKEPAGYMSLLKGFIQQGFTRSSTEHVVFEGNVMKNIDPYCVLPDPDVSVHKLSDGDFFGWVERTSMLNLLSKEQMDDEVFNVKYLKHMGGRKSTVVGQNNDHRQIKWGGKDSLGEDIKQEVDVIYMYVRLIPKEVGVGQSEYPEIWLVALAGDEIVVECRPLGLNHGQIPATISAPDFDGYSITPMSRLETVYGLQSTLDWLFSSHVNNVKKAINDMLIVDPYLVNMKDLENPEPGKLIRLRRAAWGKGVDGAVKQLVVNDVTRGHINDAGYIIDLMSRITGSNDAAMGFMRKTSGDISAAEANASTKGGISRMERLAYVTAQMAMSDLAYLFASHTQQLQTSQEFVKIVGDDLDNMTNLIPGSRMKVKPSDLLVDYDVETDQWENAGNMNEEGLTKAFQVMMQNPEMGGQFDVVKVFKQLATMWGVKDVNSFAKQGGGMVPSVQPNEQVLREAERGNLVPLA